MEDQLLAILQPFQVSISVIPTQWEGDNEKLCVMEPCLWLKGFLPPAGTNLRTTRSGPEV